MNLRERLSGLYEGTRERVTSNYDYVKYVTVPLIAFASPAMASDGSGDPSRLEKWVGGIGLAALSIITVCLSDKLQNKTRVENIPHIIFTIPALTALMYGCIKLAT